MVSGALIQYVLPNVCANAPGTQSDGCHATNNKLGMSPEQVVSDVLLKPMPKGVFISLEELSGIAQFLISDIARNITGQTIVVDGGWTAR